MPTPGSRAPLSPLLPHAALGVAACVVAFGVHAWVYRFAQDDAYISLQSARNLVEGHGLVFNAGERVEGYSNFLWTILLAAFLKLGLPALDLARIFGVVLAAASIPVAARFAAAIEGAPGAATIATAALVAGSSALAFWSGAGLETGLAVLLTTAALERGMAPGVSARARRAAPLLFALATLTRPDAPLLFAGWFAVRAFDTLVRPGPLRDPLGVRGLALDVAIYLAPLIPWAAWKLSFYGDLLPNTYYAKGGFSAEYFARGLTEAGAFVKTFGLWGVLPLLAILSVRHPVHGRLLAALGAVLALFSLYVIAVGGDVLPVFRLWLPIVPLGSMLVVFGAMEAARLATRRRRARAFTAAALVAWAAVNIVLNRPWIGGQRTSYIRGRAVTAAIAAWLAERVPPGEAIAAVAVGQVAFDTRRPVIDMLGLTDREIARHPRYIDGLTDTWKEKKYNAESVLRRRPRAIVFSTGARPSAKAEKALFLYEDFHTSYYARSYRADPTTIWTNTVFWLRDDAPAPPDSMVPFANLEFLEHYAEGLRVQSRGGNFADAIAAFERSVKTGPDYAVSPIEWWASLRYQARDLGAIPVLEEIVRVDPYALRAHVRLAHYLALAGDLDRAASIDRHVVAINPDDADAYQGLAAVAYGQERFEEAVELATQSLELWSTNESAIDLYARASVALGRFDDAERAYAAILARDPRSALGADGVQWVREERAGAKTNPTAGASPQ